MNVIWRPFSTKGESDATEVQTNCNLEVDSKQSPNCRTATRTRWRRSSGAYSCPSGEESRVHRARSGARTATAAPSTSSARARTAAATAPTSRAARFAVSSAPIKPQSTFKLPISVGNIAKHFSFQDALREASRQPLTEEDRDSEYKKCKTKCRIARNV